MEKIRPTKEWDEGESPTDENHWTVFYLRQGTHSLENKTLLKDLLLSSF